MACDSSYPLGRYIFVVVGTRKREQPPRAAILGYFFGGPGTYLAR